MPFVHPTKKRRRHDDDDGASLYNLHTPGPEGGDSLFLDQPSDRPRKVLPLPPKRARIHHPDDQQSSPHRRRLSHEHMSLKPRPGVLTPCHICARHPTRRTHLDSFAHCQACGEWTCYICIRECRGVGASYGGSVVSEQEALSRSFHMDDASPDDDGDASPRAEPMDDSHRPGHGDWPWRARGHKSIVCRRCCVEQTERDGEVACWACHLALDGGLG